MISLRRYTRLLAAPGIRGLLLRSLPGRVPIGMASLALLLLAQELTGSYARAGLVAGFYVAGLAVLAPALGRLIDRTGPRTVLLATALGYPVALAAVVALLYSGASLALVAAFALAAGALFPPVTICVRSMLPRLTGDITLAHTAYSLDAVIIEIMFIVGPALVAGFAAAGATVGAVVFMAVSAGYGAWLFARAGAIHRWRPEPVSGRRGLLGPLRVGALRTVFAATLFYSVAFALFEMAVIASAEIRGAKAAAGVILALASVGSAAGAFYYGSREWRAAPARQFVVATLMMAAGILLMIPLDDLVWLGLASVLAAAPMATVISTQSVLVSHHAPAGMVAESFTWGATCLLAGIGGGFVLGGALVEMWSPAAVFLAAACATAFAAVIAGVGLRAR